MGEDGWWLKHPHIFLNCQSLPTQFLKMDKLIRPFSSTNFCKFKNILSGWSPERVGSGKKWDGEKIV